jgi:phosphoribosyl-AMP cyclohydrolase
MLAFINKEAYMKTLETGKAHFYSTSRDKYGLREKSQDIHRLLMRYFLTVTGMP